MKANLVFVFAEGNLVTPCDWNKETGKISGVRDIEDDRYIIRSFIKTDDGEEKDVCEYCGEFVLVEDGHCPHCD